MDINSGNAVPNANKDGSINPYELDNATGIKVIKNKMNIVGQNANERLKPNKNEPNGIFLSLDLEGFNN